MATIRTLPGARHHAPWAARRGVAIGYLLAMSVSTAAAQHLHAGARIRLWPTAWADTRPIVGTLTHLGVRELEIVPRGRVFGRPFAFGAIDRLQVSRGHPTLLRFGAVAVGAGIGSWIGARFLGPDDRCRLLNDRNCAWLTNGTLVGAAGGAVLVSFAVALLVPELWRDVPLDVLRAGLVTAPDAGARLTIGFRMRF